MKGKVFKYQKYHDSLECDCPNLENLSFLNGTYYRYVFEDCANYNNHHPPLLIDPNRVDLDECETKCLGYALSLFKDRRKAESKLKSHLSRKPLLADVFGNCIGQINITEEDGMGDKAGKSGHFNFHEFLKDDPNDRFEIELLCKIEIE